MASGKQHAYATKYLWKRAVPLSLLLTTVTLDPTYTGLAVGLTIGHLLTPDIDHHYWTYEEYRIYRWNRFLGTLWHYYWVPYEKLHRHRGLSHTFALGTLGRALYLLWPLIGITLPYAPYWWLALFIGWLAQDTVHLYLDRSKRKRKQR